MPDREKVISNLEQQIRWIEEIECHQFPGWLNVTNAIRDALALLKEQKTMMQCIKGKCRICPHCTNCDVDENGLLKEQEAVVHPEPSCEMTYITDCCCDLCGVQLIREDNFCRCCGKRIEWEGG